MPIPISQVLPFVPWVILVSGVANFIIAYFHALFRTNPNNSEYVPPENRFWSVFTLGDIFAWVYATLWLPVFLYIGLNIAYPQINAYLSDIYATSDDLKIPFILYLLIFTCPIGAEIIRSAVNKRL